MRLSRYVGDGDVADRDETGAAADGRPVDARDDRLGAAVDLVQHQGEPQRVLVVLLLGVVDDPLHPVHVGAGAKAAAFAGEHGDADFGIVADRGEGLDQVHEHLVVERVADVRAVQRDPRDGALAGQAYGVVSHWHLRSERGDHCRTGTALCP
jgi:hypothetical protein